MTQDDRDALADKRFQIMVDISRKSMNSTAGLPTPSRGHQRQSEAQLRLYNIKAEIAAAKLEKMRDNVQ